jgi:hypothetical protein
MAAQSDDILKQLFAGLIGKEQLHLILVWNSGFVHENLDGGKDFHGDRESFTGVFVLVGVGEILELIFEFVEDMGVGIGL